MKLTADVHCAYSSTTLTLIWHLWLASVWITLLLWPSLAQWIPSQFRNSCLPWNVLAQRLSRRPLMLVQKLVWYTSRPCQESVTQRFYLNRTMKLLGMIILCRHTGSTKIGGLMQKPYNCISGMISWRLVHFSKCIVLHMPDSHYLPCFAPVAELHEKDSKECNIGQLFWSFWNFRKCYSYLHFQYHTEE